jgi:uncharacterized RDD family membrane protein YckC
MVYDGLLVMALWLATLFPMVAWSNAAVTGPAIRSVLFLEMFAFFAYFWMRRGQTLGMLAWRLELQTVSGGQLTLGLAIRRFLAGIASFACLGLGFLWMLFDSSRRTWTDLASASRIMHAPPRAPP